MEDIATVLQREDVRYALKQKEVYYREYYRKLYGYKYISFYDNYALNWILHRSAFAKVHEYYDISDSELETLLAHNLMARMWGVKKFSGHNSVYEAFYKGTIARAVYASRMRKLKKAGLIVYISKSSIKWGTRERMLAVKVPNDRVVILSDACNAIIDVYNHEFGIRYNQMIRANPSLLDRSIETIDKLIGMRDELTGNKDEDSELLKKLLR